MISVARSQRMVTTSWDVDSVDWTSPGVSRMTRKVVRKARSGSIILLHDGGGDRRQTMAALPGIIRGLKNRGFHFITVPDMLKLRSRYRLR